MTTSRADLPVVIDRASMTPLVVQIAGQLRDAVTSGALTAGGRLPSTRDLAGALGVSRTVVTGAYTQLFAEGWLEGRHGSGTYVADVAPLATSADACPAPEAGPLADRHNGVVPAKGMIELNPGVPWTAGIDQSAWRRAWRMAGALPPSAWPDPFGTPELRAEVAAYLGRSRGLAVRPEEILITRGVTSGLAMLAAALVRPGDRVGVEEPGYSRAREVLARAGAVVVPCPVDQHGLVPDHLPDGLRLLYTTPAHQYPLGGRLPVRRRQALAAWARANRALIVEDDYDSEFRYDVGPLPTLRSIDPEVIAYLGTTSKTLTPTFGVGWLLAPRGLVDRLADVRDGVAQRVSEPAQHALTALLASGDLERHIRRMRLEYARRRAALVGDLVVGELGPASPNRFRLLGDTAGMHVVLELPPGGSATTVAQAAWDRGVSVATLEHYFAGPVTVEGLILGYGATSMPDVRRAAAVLREVFLSDYRELTAGRCLPGWLGRSARGGTVTSQVIRDDGAEGTISDHLREDRRKGTRGLNDEYLSGLHRTLHQASREPAPEHAHPGEADEDAGQEREEQERPDKKAKRDKHK
jgi:GntR family transcriptional regulator/MocR family aminotransferase